MSDRSQDSGKITGAEFAARLLAIDKPERNLDHLLEKLSAKTSTGWESNLLELKATYHPSPNFPDDPDYKQPAVFEWNVMHAFIALANAQGGCVVIGINETKGHRLVPGDWDPDEIITKRDTNGIRQSTGKESKDLINSIEALFFGPKRQNNGSSYQFRKQDPKRPQAPANQYTYELTAKTVKRLHALVKFYSCHSTACNCNAIVAIVDPVAQGDATLTVKRKRNQSDPETIMFYRDLEAQTKEHADWDEIRTYERSRDPASSDFYKQLHAPLEKPSAQPPCSSFSTMRKPGDNFTGRGNEIIQLKEACASGKIALITAPGGTGKTQLALKFAERASADYPGGQFFVPVECAASWDDILHSLIDQHNSSNGLTPEEWLGLVDKASSDSQKNQSDKHPPPSKQPYHILTLSEIVNALKRKAINVGRLLLVLDNMDNPALLLSEASLLHVFPQGIPVGFHIVVTARSHSGITAGRCPSVTPIELCDISTEDARAILNNVKPFNSSEESNAANEIIRLLDRRALYISRIANLAESYSERPYARLLRRLEHDKLEVVKPQQGEDDQRTPIILWQWVKNKIAESPNGQKDIMLLQSLALFPPDGIPQGVLEALWYADFGSLKGKKILSAYEDDPSLFGDALKRLSTYDIFQKDDVTWTFRMHRLDRIAILKDLDDNHPDSHAQLGEAIRSCPFLSEKDWIRFAKVQPNIMEFCPWDALDKWTIDQILIAYPGLSTYVPQRFLASERSSSELATQESLSDNPDELLKQYPTEDLYGSTWVNALTHNQALASSCHWERLKINDWLLLLTTHPEMIGHNPHPEIFTANTKHKGETEAYDIKAPTWGSLLSMQPQMETICPWQLLGHEDCVSILIHAPQFKCHFPSDFWDSLNEEDWTAILSMQPSLFKHFLDTLQSREEANQSSTGNSDADDKAPFPWGEIISAQPALKNQIPFDQLPGSDWYELLHTNPELVSQNPPWQRIFNYIKKNKLLYGGFIDLCFKPEITFPACAAFQSPITKLSESEYTELVRKLWQENRCDISFFLSQLQPAEVSEIILDERLRIFAKHPCLKLASYFTGGDHTYLSRDFPMLKSLYLNDDDGHDAQEWQDLMHAIDQAFDKQYPGPLPICNDSNPSSPQEADPYLDITDYLSDKKFKFLSRLKPYPDYDDTHALTSDEVIYSKLITYFVYMEMQIGEILNLRKKHAAEALIKEKLSNLSGIEVALLLCVQPSFATICDWMHLNGKELCLLMIHRPSLARYCDWTKFGGLEWSVLLTENPEFADKCDWAILSSDDWDYLLSERPWMSKFKPDDQQ